jgi:hypothetical protein
MKKLSNTHYVIDEFLLFRIEVIRDKKNNRKLELGVFLYDKDKNKSFAKLICEIDFLKKLLHYSKEKMEEETKAYISDLFILLDEFNEDVYLTLEDALSKDLEIDCTTMEVYKPLIKDHVKGWTETTENIFIIDAIYPKRTFEDLLEQSIAGGKVIHPIIYTSYRNQLDYYLQLLGEEYRMFFFLYTNDMSDEESKILSELENELFFRIAKISYQITK